MNALSSTFGSYSAGALNVAGVGGGFVAENDAAKQTATNTGKIVDGIKDLGRKVEGKKGLVFE
jgi:hypothetical protein